MKIKILRTNEVKFEYEIKNNIINLELIFELLDTTESNNMETNMFNISMNEKENTILLIKIEDSVLVEIFTIDIKETNQLEINADELNKNKIENY